MSGFSYLRCLECSRCGSEYDAAVRHGVSLGEGMTPLLRAPRLAAELGVQRLLIKDDGLLPTGSFKARGASVGVSRTAELGVRRVAMPTNGNAGAAWATYAARAGIAIVVAAGRRPRTSRESRRLPPVGICASWTAASPTPAGSSAQPSPPAGATGST